MTLENLSKSEGLQQVSAVTWPNFLCTVSALSLMEWQAMWLVGTFINNLRYADDENIAHRMKF